MFEDQYDDPHQDHSLLLASGRVTAAQIVGAVLAIAALAMFLASAGVLA